MEVFIGAADRALRAMFAPAHASRPIPGTASATGTPSPGETATEPEKRADPVGTGNLRGNADLSDSERHGAASLMRINHAGEIAAQGLYHGQALAARSGPVRELLLRAAREETDHLAWCEHRLKELGSRPSVLNPLWYCGSFAVGLGAALLGDRTSLAFVLETERQVEGHLDSHLTRLPAADRRSRAILEVMKADEIAHGTAARSAGAPDLPGPVSALMRMTARIMTGTAYWI